MRIETGKKIVYERVEAILLNAAVDGDQMSLRIDNNGFLLDSYHGPGVTTLEVRGCRMEPGRREAFTSAVDLPIWYEIVEEEKTVTFFLNYMDDPIDAAYESISTVDEAYTVEDLLQKGKRLARAHFALEEESDRLRVQHQRFVERLEKAVAKEINVDARKAEFFRGRDPEKAAHLEGGLAAYRKVEKLMGQSLEETRGD